MEINSVTLMANLSLSLRYLTGLCSNTEQLKIERILEQDVACRAFITDLEAALTVFGGDVDKLTDWLNDSANSIVQKTIAKINEYEVVE